MSALEIRNLSKSFGTMHVIKDIRLTVGHSEFTVLVGPSGCGKSTLLRMIAGLERPTAGQILIGGKEQSHGDIASRGVAMVFQSYALYPHMTVAESISFAMKVAGKPKAEIDRRVAEVATSLQLDHLLTRKPKQLSGGQRARVAIGRAIGATPKCSSLTNRCRTLTPNCACICAARSHACTNSLARPWSMSPMIRWKP